MPRICGSIASGLWRAAPLFFALSFLAPAALAQEAAPAAAPPVPKRHKSHKAPPPLVLPPLPAGPLRQLPMDQIPPTPATVGYQNGLLTISAQNSTLGEILRDVRKLTGASFDIPPHSSGADERVIVSLGPGAPRDILAALLNGSSFNYVMMGSDSDPTALATVILTPKASAPGENQAADNANPGAMPPNGFPGSQPFNQQNMLSRAGRGQPGNVEADDNKDDSQDDADAADDSADDQTQPAATVPNQPQPQDPNQPNAAPRTPEQILEMIQRQRPQPPTAVNPPPQQ